MTKIKLASGEEIDVGDPALLDPEIREALIAASDTGPIDIKGAADRAMRRAWEDLNAPEKAIVGFRGKTRSIASGALEMLGIAPESVEYFENVERPAIEAGSGDLAGELGAALPNIMGGPARLGPAIAFEAGMESLAAPAGQGASAGAEAAGWALGGGLAGKGLGMAADFAADTYQRVSRAVAEMRATAGAVPDPGTVTGNVRYSQQIRELTPGERAANLVETGTALDELMAPEVPAVWNRLVSAGDRLGLQATPGQRAGNKARQQLEASLASTPGLSEPFIQMADNNADMLAQYLGRAMGVNTKSLDETSLAAAHGLVTEQFGRIADEIGPNIREAEGAGAAIQTFLQDINRAAQIERRDITRAVRRKDGVPVPDQATGVADETVRNITDLIDPEGVGQVSGAELMAWRSNVVARMDSLQRSGKDPSSLLALGDMVEAMDDLMLRVAGPDVATRYRTVRSQYRLQKTLENVLRGDGALSSRTIRNRLAAEYPEEFRRGGLRSDLSGLSEQDAALAAAFDAVKWSATVGQDVVANSGTATRSYIPMLQAQAPKMTAGEWAMTGAVQMGGGDAATRFLLSIPSRSGGDAAEMVGTKIGQGAGALQDEG